MTENIMPANLLIESGSPEETERIGYGLGQSSSPGDVIALYGELGSGKTCLVKGVARGLNITTQVKSPSYSIINEYPGVIPLVHIDFYRLEKPAEIEDLGWLEYLDTGAVVVIEWAERAKNMLPSRRIDVYFEILNKTARRLEIIAVDNPGN